MQLPFRNKKLQPRKKRSLAFGNAQQTKKKRHLVKYIFLGALALITMFTGFYFYQAAATGNKIAGGNLNIFRSLVEAIPGVESKLNGEEDGRINVLLLGMRGENVPGGGLLADTVMVLSAQLGEESDGEVSSPTFSIISLPRDMYVAFPETDTNMKLNAIYAHGESLNRNGGGIDAMEQVVEDVSGQEMHYYAVINFMGFQQLIDALGGIDIYLEEPFVESQQFHQKQVCDPIVFTIPANEFQIKKNEKGKIVAQYPLCYNNNEECGGVFELPAGNVHLDGEDALCYVRSRYSSDDFDRARRQQDVIEKLKDKALDMGTFSDFSKINTISRALGDNARTDMQLWEMERIFKLFLPAVSDPDLRSKVLQNSEDGLLYHPENSGGAGYILLPRGNNYDRIHDVFRTIVQ